MAELRKKSSSRRPSKGHAMPSYDVKCVVLGDGDVGKTAMLLTYLTGHFPEESSPGPMDGLSEYNHLTQQAISLTHENTNVRMTLMDTYGQDEYDKLRERICGHADVYLLCYDVTRPLTFERLRHHWIPEFRRYSAPGTPFVVVGLKTDVRSKTQAGGGGCDDIGQFVTFGDGRKGSEDIGASHYVECSARNNTGVKRVMETVAQTAVLHVLPANMKRSSCVLS